LFTRRELKHKAGPCEKHKNCCGIDGYLQAY